MTDAPLILIADSGHDALNYLKEELANFELLHAKDGDEALSIVDSEEAHIAVAVVELELPVVNGFDLIGRLTAKQPKPKIIVTTFLEHEPLLELAKHMGADAIVRKPRPEETWVGTLRQLLPEPSVDAPIG